MTPRRGVAANGNSNDIATWSGSPHYLLQAGRARGFLQGGLDLRVEPLDEMRFNWHVSRLLRGQRPRGFQYSQTFLAALGRKAVEECNRFDLKEVISHYQLFPARSLRSHSITTSYYIDTTLQDLFSTHGMFEWLNRRIAQEAIETERAEYHAACRIVTMASWVRESLVRTYGVSAALIHTVLPGANLPEEGVRRRLQDRGPSAVPDRFTTERPLRVGFTGKDWKRKGLPRLVAAIELLNRANVPATVVVIGNVPPEYHNHTNVHAAGFIDKSRDLPRFIELVESCDLGCAPSHEEPMGIAPLEYLRLGVPVLCTAAGGLSDVCEAAGAASILLGKEASAEEIAATLEKLARGPDILQRMRTAAWARKEYFSWDRTVLELDRVWSNQSTALARQKNAQLIH